MRVAAFPWGRHVSANSLFADQHMPDELVEITKDMLAREGIAVSSVNLLGWEVTQNGRLHIRAKREGYEVMFTFDKAMADEIMPLMPVLVLDLVTAPEMREASKAIADALLGDEIRELDYHALALPSADPSPGLIHIAAGLYGQNPRPNFKGRGFTQAFWDKRTLDYSDDLQRRSKRARMSTLSALVLRREALARSAGWDGQSRALLRVF